MIQDIHSRISKVNCARIYDAYQNRGAPRTALSGQKSKASFDKLGAVPLISCCFALFVFPLFEFINPVSQQAVLNRMEARLENRIFWPAMAVISIILALQHRSRFNKFIWPPHILCLLAYIAFAGASILWAFSA